MKPAPGIDAQLDAHVAEYTRSRSKVALDQAIDRARQLTRRPPPTNPAVAGILVSLLISRGQSSNSVDDLTEALHHIADLRSRPALQMGGALVVAECAALTERAQRTGEAADLERVIEIGRTVPREPSTSAQLDNYYGGALLGRFQSTREYGLLSEAVEVLGRSRQDARDPLLRAAAANNLAVALLERYQLSASEPDLQVAVDLTSTTRRELERCGLPIDAVAGPRAAADITRASLLATRWRYRAEPTDLSEARAAFQRVLRTLPDNHPMVHGAAAGYASLACDLATARDDIKAAATAIRLYRSVLAATPEQAVAHAAAATGLVTALQLQSQLAGDVDSVEEAIGLQRQLLARSGPDAQAGLHQHNLGVLLATRYAITTDPYDIDEAINHHEAALATPLRHGIDGDLLKIRLAYALVQRFAAGSRAADSERAVELLKAAAERPGITIRRIQGLRLLAQLAELIGDDALAERAAHRALNAVESMLGALDLTHWDAWLSPMQGTAAVGAVAAGRLNHVHRAVTFLERGCAVQASARLAQQSLTLAAARQAGHGAEVDSYVEAARHARSMLTRDMISARAPLAQPGENQRREFDEAVSRLQSARSALEAKAGSLLVGGAVEQLIEFAARHGVVLDYLVAGTTTGARFRLDGRGAGVEWLPTFTTSTVDQLGEALYQSEIHSHGPVRGSNSGPSQQDLEHVLVTLRGIVQPRSTGKAPLKLVSVGKAAVLPLASVLAENLPGTVISVAGSGELHRMATIRTRPGLRRRSPSISAVTNPQPCHWAQKQWPHLPGADQEGLLLQQDYGARTFRGRHATASSLVAEFKNPEVDAVHIAAHGITNAGDDLICVLLADDPSGQATTISEHDLPTRLDGKLVFLASCWTGKNLDRLPDEAAGFTTWLLQAGASSVIAPLWPVDDAATLRYVEAFYRHWCNDPNGAARAATLARRDLVRWASNSATADPGQRAAVFSCAHAFIAAGA